MTITYRATNVQFVAGKAQTFDNTNWLDVAVPVDVADEDVEDFIADAIEKASGIQPWDFDFEPMKLTRNILNSAAGEFYIPANTPLCCDPGSETYHSM